MSWSFLAVIARRLSESGINNLTLASEIISHEQAEEALRESEKNTEPFWKLHWKAAGC